MTGTGCRGLGFGNLTIAFFSLRLACYSFCLIKDFRYEGHLELAQGIR